jgi:hypothetical protein
MRDMFAADGYELALREDAPGELTIEIKAGPDACAECLVSKEIMRAQFEAALSKSFELDVPKIKLVYPTDAVR